MSSNGDSDGPYMQREKDEVSEWEHPQTRDSAPFHSLGA